MRILRSPKERNWTHIRYGYSHFATASQRHQFKKMCINFKHKPTSHRFIFRLNQILIKKLKHTTRCHKLIL